MPPCSIDPCAINRRTKTRRKTMRPEASISYLARHYERPNSLASSRIGDSTTPEKNKKKKKKKKKRLSRSVSPDTVMKGVKRP
jgi:hypothetical protein